MAKKSVKKQDETVQAAHGEATGKPSLMALQEKVTAYTADGKQHPVDRTLDALSEQFDPKLFFRANRQFIISRKAIKDVDLWFGSRLAVNLVLPVPERIVISKIKSPFFKKWISSEES